MGDFHIASSYDLSQVSIVIEFFKQCLPSTIYNDVNLKIQEMLHHTDALLKSASSPEDVYHDAASKKLKGTWKFFYKALIHDPIYPKHMSDLHEMLKSKGFFNVIECNSSIVDNDNEMLIDNIDNNEIFQKNSGDIYTDTKNLSKNTGSSAHQSNTYLKLKIKNSNDIVNAKSDANLTSDDNMELNTSDNPKQTLKKRKNKKVKTKDTDVDSSAAEISDSEFMQPKKTCKAQILTEITSDNITTQNRFKIPVSTSKINANSGNKVQTQKSTIEDSTDDEAFEETPTRTPKPESFYIKTEEGWRQQMNQLFTKIKWNLPMKLIGDFVKITPRSIDEFRAVQSFLHENKVKCYGMNPRGERPRKILIKGVPLFITSDEIHKEFTKYGYHVTRVAQLRDFRTKAPLTKFVVNILPDENFSKVYDIDLMFGFMVEIVKFETRNKIKQCYNCQKWNHSSEVCHLDPICVKCAGGHNSKECPQGRTAFPKCSNCGQQHTANYGGCPANPLNIKKVQQLAKLAKQNPQPAIISQPQIQTNPQTQIPTQTQHQFIPQQVTKAISYAKTVSKNLPKTPIQPAQQQPHIQPQNSSFFNSPQEVMKFFDEMIVRLEKIYDLCQKLKMPDFATYMQSFLPINIPMTATQATPETFSTTVPTQSFQKLTLNQTAPVQTPNNSTAPQTNISTQNSKVKINSTNPT